MIIIRFILVFIGFASCQANDALTGDVLENRYERYAREIGSRTDIDMIEKREGYKTLKSIYSFSRELASCNTNYYNPYVLEWINDDRKFAGDNPDTRYFSFFVDPDADYEIKLPNENIFFIEITSYKTENGMNKISSSVVVKNGGISVLEVSANRTQKPVLLLGKHDYIIMIRCYRNDRKIDITPPFVLCTRVPYRKKSIGSKVLDGTALSLFDALYNNSNMLTNNMMQKVNEYVDEIDMSNPYVNALFPACHNIYNGVFIQIPDGSYIRIKGVIDKKRYAIFVFYNRWWATPFGETKSVAINTRELKTDEFGNYEIVISKVDMGRDNNIVTGNLSNGIFSIRSLYVAVEEPSIEVIKMK